VHKASGGGSERSFQDDLLAEVSIFGQCVDGCRSAHASAPHDPLTVSVVLAILLEKVGYGLGVEHESGFGWRNRVAGSEPTVCECHHVALETLASFLKVRDLPINSCFSSMEKQHDTLSIINM